MTFLEAALEVLKRSTVPLTTREILETIVERNLVQSTGRTPLATLSATLYTNVGKSHGLVRLFEPGNSRARNGSVRWTLEHRQTQS